MRGDIPHHVQTALAHSRSIVAGVGCRPRTCMGGRYDAFRSAQGYGPEQSEAQRDDGPKAYKDTHGRDDMTRCYPRVG